MGDGPARRSRKDEFLDRVIDELMSNGLSEMSLRDLAARIGTSHRILIYHFTSKDNLINLAVSEVRRRERESFELSTAKRDLAGGGDLRESLHAFFDHNISAGMRPYFRLLYEVWGRAQAKPDSWAGVLDGIVLGWVDSLAAVFMRAGYDEALACSRATLVLAALRGLQLDLFTTHEEDRVRRAFDALIDLLVSESVSLPSEPAGAGGHPHQEAQPLGNTDA